ncbi:hypothetical protein B0H11DRAFT_1914348 [Mycena galericulata]|nr:hypothetical protein B0H11DRAFT_1914348 [Mycena galericulata]
MYRKKLMRTSCAVPLPCCCRAVAVRRSWHPGTADIGIPGPSVKNVKAGDKTLLRHWKTNRDHIYLRWEMPYGHTNVNPIKRRSVPRNINGRVVNLTVIPWNIGNCFTRHK